MLHKRIVAVVLIGLAVVGTSGFLWYRSQVVQMYRQAEQLYLALDAPRALDSFARIASYPTVLGHVVGDARAKASELREYMDIQAMLVLGQHDAASLALRAFAERHTGSPFAARVRTAEIPDVLRLWAGELSKEKRYQETVRCLERVVDEFPEYPHAEAVRGAIAETKTAHLAWVQDLLGGADYAGAVGELEVIRVSYADLATYAEATLLQAFAAWAESLLASQAYSDAIEKYRIIIRRFPDTDGAKQARAALPRIHADWARQTLAQGNREKAITIYRLIGEEFPGAEAASEAQATLPRIYFDWAGELLLARLHGEAIGKLKILIQGFPESELSSRARADLPELYADWATELLGAQRHGEAIAKLETLVRDFPESQPAKQAAERLPQMYFDWAERLLAEGKYDEAVRQYTLIIERFPDSELIPRAEAGRTEAEVKRLAALKAREPQSVGDLPSPEGVRVAGIGEPMVVIKNSTKYVLTVRYLGPTIRTVSLQPGATTTIRLKPGRYQEAATVADPKVTPFYGVSEYVSDYAYNSEFYIATTTVPRPSGQPTSPVRWPWP